MISISKQGSFDNLNVPDLFLKLQVSHLSRHGTPVLIRADADNSVGKIVKLELQIAEVTANNSMVQNLL